MTTTAILIDPAERTVERITLTQAQSRNLAAVIGCDIFTYVGITPQIGLYLDDEGLLRGGAPQRGFFTFYGHDSVLCGRALLCTHDREGEISAVGLPPVATVRKLIRWHSHAEAYALQVQLDQSMRERAAELEKAYGMPVIFSVKASELIGDPADLPQEGQA